MKPSAAWGHAAYRLEPFMDRMANAFGPARQQKGRADSARPASLWILRIRQPQAFAGAAFTSM